MVNPALLEYVKRRTAYGDSLSDIKQDLQAAGYSIDAIDMAFQEINKDVMVTEKVLSVSPVAIPGTSKIQVITDILKRFSKYRIFVVLAVVLGILYIMLSHLDFSKINWGETILVGGIYFVAFVLVALIQALVVYSIHQSSMAHLSVHLSFWPIALACVGGEFFSVIISQIAPAITIWVPIIIGCAIFIMIMIGAANSNTREIISSGVIFCALTFFLFVLIENVYTKETLLKLFGMG